jgi:hypothetical protein
MVVERRGVEVLALHKCIGRHAVSVITQSASVVSANITAPKVYFVKATGLMSVEGMK